MIGQYIALHGGKNPGAATAGIMEDFSFIQDQSKQDLIELYGGAVYIEGVFAVAKLERVITESDDPWFFGPYGLVLTEYVRLKKPVPCRGMQGFFALEPEVLAAVRAEFRRCAAEAHLEPVDQGDLFKPVLPDPEDAADYLESVQAAEETPVTSAQLDAVLEPTIVQESLEPAPAFALPESFVLERQRLTDGLMAACPHLNEQLRAKRLEHLNGLDLEKLCFEFAEYASGSAARALNLKRLPDWDQLPGGVA